MKTEKEFSCPKSHPRYDAILLRHRLTQSCKKGITAYAGLLAHGRGEAFDYLLGEQTHPFALKAIEAAAAAFLSACYPVVCVNGNSVVLAAQSSVELADLIGGKIEVNLFYRTAKRERLIARELKKAGADEVLGIHLHQKVKQMPSVDHARGRMDPNGVYKSDWVWVPLEDGDRSEALIRMGKKVITVDLNPLSRTAQSATITIVDNITRCLPLLNEKIKALKGASPEHLNAILKNYDNAAVLTDALAAFSKRLAPSAPSPSESFS